MSTKTIYLIRHAQPDYPNSERMCLGQKNDLPLSQLGFEQAAHLGKVFRNENIEAVYSSPLLRTRQTASCIANDCRPLIILDQLIELYGGDWDGRPFSEIHAEYPEYFIPGSGFSCPPGGESDEAGLARICAALNEVERRTEKSAVIVAHSGVNRLLLCHLLGKPLSEKKQISQRYASVSTLQYTNGVWHVKEVDTQSTLSIYE